MFVYSPESEIGFYNAEALDLGCSWGIAIGLYL